MSAGNKTDVLNKLKEAIANLNIQAVQEACKEALSQGLQAYEIITNGMAKGVEIVGHKYETGEFFLSELIIAGECMRKGLEIAHARTRAICPWSRPSASQLRRRL